jgi:hypothetical protein
MDVSTNPAVNWDTLNQILFGPASNDQEERLMHH